MIITKETDYALRILRVLLDGEKHSVAEMSETELIPNQFAYQILRKLSAGNLVRVSRGALGGCALSCDLDATSLYAVSYTHLDVYKRQPEQNGSYVRFYAYRLSFALQNFVTVAYTHLDVYKRQVRLSISKRSSLSRPQALSS